MDKQILFDNIDLLDKGLYDILNFLLIYVRKE